MTLFRMNAAYKWNSLKKIAKTEQVLITPSLLENK